MIRFVWSDANKMSDLLNMGNSPFNMLQVVIKCGWGKEIFDWLTKLKTLKGYGLRKHIWHLPFWKLTILASVKNPCATTLPANPWSRMFSYPIREHYLHLCPGLSPLAASKSCKQCSLSIYFAGMEWMNATTEIFSYNRPLLSLPSPTFSAT